MTTTQTSTQTARTAHRVTGWYAEQHCCLLYLEGGDPASVADRVAFIEKSPRIRTGLFNDDDNDWRNWKYGPKGDSGRETAPGVWGDYDEDSRAWCEAELRALGYDLSAVQP